MVESETRPMDGSPVGEERIEDIGDAQAQVVVGGEYLGFFNDFTGGRVQQDAVCKSAASIDAEMQGRNA